MRASLYLLLLVPLVGTSATLYPMIVPKALLARTLITVMVACWLAAAIVDPSQRPPRRSRVLLALVAYLGVALIAAFAGTSPTRSLWSTFERMGGVIDLAHWTAFVVVLASTLRGRDAWWWPLNVNLIVGVVVAVVALAQHRGLGVLPYYSATPGYRVDASLGNATFLGAYMMVGMLLAMTYLAAEGEAGRGWRLFWTATAILDASVLVLSGTRAAFGGALVGLVVLVLARLARAEFRRPAVGIALFSASAAAAVALGLTDPRVRDVLARTNVMAERMAQISVSKGELAIRLALWKAGVAGVRDRPLLGWGPENFAAAFERHAGDDYFRVTKAFPDHPHSQVVEELTTKGVVGLLSYVTLYAAALVALRRKFHEGDVFWAGIAAALVAYLVQSQFLFETPVLTAQLMLLLAVAASTEARAAPGHVGAPPAGRTTALLAVLLAVAVPVVIRFDHRPYRASVLAAAALRPQDRAQLPFPERLQMFRESFELSPALANRPLYFLLVALANSWDRLVPADRAQALATVEAETGRALERDPFDLPVRLGAAKLYRAVARTDSTYRERADRYWEEARRLSPIRVSHAERRSR